APIIKIKRIGKAEQEKVEPPKVELKPRPSQIDVKPPKIQHELSVDTHASMIELVNHVIDYAHKVRASDIHLDPQADSLRLRLRIDGVLHDTKNLPKSIHAEVISRIKIMSGLRTDEHQAAQDGRFRITAEDKTTVDIRVSIAPTYYGENAVLRLLSDQAQDF